MTTQSPGNEETRRLASVVAAASYIGVSESTLWRMLRDGQLSRVRVRGRTLIRYSDMDALLSADATAAR